MPSPTKRQLTAENEELRARLQEAEETLRAIRSGEVDALMVQTDLGEQVFTLRDADRTYRILIEQMNEGALTLAMDGTILYANRRFADMLGAPLEEVIGSPVAEWVTHPSQAAFRGLMQSAARGTARAELTLAAADGRTVPAYFSASTIPTDGMADTLGIVATDLTQRRQAEDALRESEQRFATIFHAAPVALALSTFPGGALADVNAAFEATFGYTKDEVLGKTTAELGIQRDPEGSARVTAELHAHGSVHNVEATLTTRSGDQRHFRLDMDTVAIGGMKFFLQTAQDITERKIAEQELRLLNRSLERRIADRMLQLSAANTALVQEVEERQKAQAEINRLNADLMQRAQALEIANKDLEAFTYSVSHDLRAPLRHVDGLSQMVVQKYGMNLPEQGQAYLGMLRENVQYMGQLLEALLTLSHASRQPLAVQEVLPAVIVHRVLEELGLERQNREIQFIIGDPQAAPEHALPLCMADPNLLHQVYVNLISNAVKFTRRCPVAIIEIGATAKDGQQIYYVKDNGVGFDMQYAGKLFGVFQRLHSDNEFEGTGAGLAIVRRIVRRHGGEIWAEAEEDKGATFYFTLPDTNP